VPTFAQVRGHLRSWSRLPERLSLTQELGSSAGASGAESQVSGWRAVVMGAAAGFGDRLGGIWEISLSAGSCGRTAWQRPLPGSAPWPPT
jgi:hypothetical protein